MSSTPLALAAGLAILIGAANGPANAHLTINTISHNAISHNAISHNAITPNGSAIGDLNGVTVEAVTLPSAPAR